MLSRFLLLQWMLTLSLWKVVVLRRPLLDDHLSKGNSEAYPRGGVCELCVMFQLFVLSCSLCSTLDFN